MRNKDGGNMLIVYKQDDLVTWQHNIKTLLYAAYIMYKDYIAYILYFIQATFYTQYSLYHQHLIKVDS